MGYETQASGIIDHAFDSPGPVFITDRRRVSHPHQPTCPGFHNLHLDESMSVIHNATRDDVATRRPCGRISGRIKERKD